jgi:hypothetical protein
VRSYLGEVTGVAIDSTIGGVLVVGCAGEAHCGYKPKGESGPFLDLGTNVTDGCAGGDAATRAGRS